MHRHVQLGVIQRSKGQTALARLAYQSCGKFRDEFGNHGDHRPARRWHLGTAILLPPGSNTELANPTKFRKLVCGAETRRDAQEGRKVDFTLPREIPAGLEPLVAAWVVAPLVRAGMAVQLDVERPPALDGAPNPHVHCYVAQRELREDGFGKKNREWNSGFRCGNGRAVRALVLSRIDAACEILGIRVDPEIEAADCRREPEPRISRKLWNARTTGEVPALEDLKRRRRERKSRHTPAEDRPAGKTVVVAINASPGVAFNPRAEIDGLIKIGERREMRSQRSGAVAVIENEQMRLTFDGSALRIEILGDDFAGVDIAEVIAEMGWKATALVGDDEQRLQLLAVLVVKGIESFWATGETAPQRGWPPGIDALLKDVISIDPSQSISATTSNGVTLETQGERRDERGHSPVATASLRSREIFEPVANPEAWAISRRQAADRALDDLFEAFFHRHQPPSGPSL